MSHEPYPRLLEPFTNKNPFRERTYHHQSIPAFSEVRSKLPIPVLPEHSRWVEMYWRAWELAWSHLRRPLPESGFVSNFIEPTFNNHVFMWDSAFMVQFGVYGRRAFNFIGTLDNFYAKQHEDGFICREIDCEKGGELYYPFDPNGAGPNILAWAEWRYYRISGQENRLAEIFWPLMAYHRWFRAHRTWPGGLYWATGLSSGMENQARIKNSKYYHQHWTWVDATMQAALNCTILEKIASLLQESAHLPELADEYRLLVERANKVLWNKRTHFYQDVNVDGRYSPVKSIGAYWALLNKGMVPEELQAEFLQHLYDKEAFNRPHRIPAQAANDPGYDTETGNRWHGGVWSPTNFMVLKGLRRLGKHSLAQKIAQNHLENVWQVYEHTDTFWENYAPETAVVGNPARPSFVGWTGLSPISILLEDLIGLWVDWPLRRVVWYRYLETNQHYGVQNYPLGPDGTLTLIGDQEKVVVTTDVPFTLTICDRATNLQAPIAAGTTEIDLT